MNKAEIINVIAEKGDLSRVDVEFIVDEFLSCIESALIKGEDVKIASFGVFTKKDRASRNGVNPSTGKPIKIDACSTAGFKPSKILKEKLN